MSALATSALIAEQGVVARELGLAVRRQQGMTEWDSVEAVEAVEAAWQRVGVLREQLANLTAAVRANQALDGLVAA